MIIQNAIFSNDNLSNEDLFIITIGYEDRSSNILKKCIERLNKKNTVILKMSKITSELSTQQMLTEIALSEIPIINIEYSDEFKVKNIIIDKIKSYRTDDKPFNTHIDYSSMPRSWFCNLPVLLLNELLEDDKVYFWYTEGNYPSISEYPSSGIESFRYFSGVPSLDADRKRVHLLGLGFDFNRAGAINSIIDPSFLVNCYAFNPNRDGFKEILKSEIEKQVTKQLIALELDLSDFSFMVSKLSETVKELHEIGDVIIVPDGPKPLIFAMSLITEIINKAGVTCLQISKNSKMHQLINVTPLSYIHGFYVQKSLKKI